jgi:DNA-binding SARP family transcriptional activator
MLAMYALGRAHEALQAYRRARELLASELGLERTQATRALETAILRQENVCSLLPRMQGQPRTSAPDGSLRF